MMLRRNDRNLENIPVGALGLIALDGCTEMGAKVNDSRKMEKRRWTCS